MAKVWASGYAGKAIENKEITKYLIAHKMPSGMQGFFSTHAVESLRIKGCVKPYFMRLILNGRIKTYSFCNTNAPPVF